MEIIFVILGLVIPVTGLTAESFTGVALKEQKLSHVMKGLING